MCASLKTSSRNHENPSDILVGGEKLETCENCGHQAVFQLRFEIGDADGFGAGSSGNFELNFDGIFFLRLTYVLWGGRGRGKGGGWAGRAPSHFLGRLCLTPPPRSHLLRWELPFQSHSPISPVGPIFSNSENLSNETKIT